MRYIFTVFLIFFSPSPAFGSTVKHELRSGPVRIEMPYWHQGMSVSGVTINITYDGGRREPPEPLASMQSVSVDANFGSAGRLHMQMSPTDVCEDFMGELEDGSGFAGRRCLLLIGSLQQKAVNQLGSTLKGYLSIDFNAAFDENFMSQGKEYLEQISVNFIWAPEDTVFLLNSNFMQ